MSKPILFNLAKAILRQAATRLIEIRDATCYAGPSGRVIEKFDERTDRWITELKAETIEETLSKLTDASEYLPAIALGSDGITLFIDDEWRDRSFYRVVVEAVLSNRRFRKAYEDLQKTNKKKAAELLSEHIRDKLTELRMMLQEDVEKVSRGEHNQGNEVIAAAPIARPLKGDYRPMGVPDYPPT